MVNVLQVLHYIVCIVLYCMILHNQDHKNIVFRTMFMELEISNSKNTFSILFNDTLISSTTNTITNTQRNNFSIHLLCLFQSFGIGLQNVFLLIPAIANLDPYVLNSWITISLGTFFQFSRQTLIVFLPISTF